MSDFEARNRDPGSSRGLTKKQRASEAKARTKAVQAPHSKVAAEAPVATKEETPRKVWNPPKHSQKTHRTENLQSADPATDELIQQSRDAAGAELDERKHLKANQAPLEQPSIVEKMSLSEVVELFSKPGVTQSDVERLIPVAVPSKADKARAESAAVAELKAAQEEVSKRSSELDRLMAEQARVEAEIAEKMAEVYGNPNAFLERMGRLPRGETPIQETPKPTLPAPQTPPAQVVVPPAAPQDNPVVVIKPVPAQSTPVLEKEVPAASGATKYPLDKESLEQIDAELKRFNAEKKPPQHEEGTQKTKPDTAPPAGKGSRGSSGKLSVAAQPPAAPRSTHPPEIVSGMTTTQNTSAAPLDAADAFTFSFSIATQGTAPSQPTSPAPKKPSSQPASTAPIVFAAPGAYTVPLAVVPPYAGPLVMAPAKGQAVAAAKEMSKQPKGAAVVPAPPKPADKIAEAQQKVLEAKARAEKAKATVERLRPSAVEFVEVTDRQIRAIVPNFPEGKKGATILEHLNLAMRRADVTTRLRKSAFIAQLAHESGGFNSFEEIADGAQYQGRKNLGNDGKDCDGKNHKGRGPIMLTGCYNYKKAGEASGLPLLQNPMLAARVDVGFWIASWYWGFKHVNEFADAPNFDKVTERVQGAIDGPFTYRERRWALYRLALAVLPEDVKAKSVSGAL